MPVFLATPQAEAGRLLKPRISRLAWAKCQDTTSKNKQQIKRLSNMKN